MCSETTLPKGTNQLVPYTLIYFIFNYVVQKKLRTLFMIHTLIVEDGRFGQNLTPCKTWIYRISGLLHICLFTVYHQFFRLQKVLVEVCARTV